MDVTPRGLAEEHWALLAAAPRRLLVLDHDGTLAPFDARRDRARAPQPTLETLARIAAEGSTRVVVVSGRPTAELAPLLEPLRCTLIGEHGWERREPDGSLQQHLLRAGATSGLAEAERAAQAADLGALLERKRTGVVLHVRGLDAARSSAARRTCRAAWTPLAADGALRLSDVHGGLEIRAADRDKGVALRELLAEEPATTAVVYVGDDETDEDAFAVLGERGLGVLVAAEARATLAQARLGDPSDVARMLEEWGRRMVSVTRASR